ncbi:MAG: LLM class F420-dependent oxidoreductase [Acidimicrobiia bacterium]
MRVSVQLPVHRVEHFDELAGAAAIAELSIAAESAGFDAVFVTEHPFPEDRWLVTGGHHAPDPFVCLALASAATTRVRLQTNLCILAYRNPFLIANTVASLDALSGGRVILGIGAGYMEGEFSALGVPYDERNDLTDEAITAMRAAWTGQSVVMEGSHFRAAGNTMLPAPAQSGGPPIWVGGNSRRAMRRAVELADGWVPMPSPAKASARLRTPGIESVTDLQARIDEAKAHAASVGRTNPLEVAFMPMGLDMFTNAKVQPNAVIDNIQELSRAGVTYACITVPGDTRAELRAGIDVFASDILPAVADA